MRKAISLIICALLAGLTSMNAQTKKTTKSDPQTNKTALQSVKYDAALGDPAAMNQLAVWYYTGQNVKQNVDKAFDLWRQAAFLQNPKAISNLGVCYQYGTGVEKDSITALRLYTTAIREGQRDIFEQRQKNVGTNPFDGMLIGLCYELGIGTEADPVKAAQAYAASAQLGSPEAMGAAARAYLTANQPANALNYAQKGAKSGNSEAQFLAGIMLTEGIGTNPSVDQGTEYLIEAARSGNTYARNQLAQMLDEGIGDLTPYRRQIATWLKESAMEGNAQAMWNYAIALINGTGTDQNFDQALNWMAKAAEVGYHDRFFDMIYNSHNPNIEAFSHYVSAVNNIAKGNFSAASSDLKAVNRKKIADGKVMEALMLINPRNPKANIKKGVKALEKLAPNSALASYALAQMYESGNGVNQSYSRAASLYQRAANAGYGKAMDRLGDLYYEGLGVTADPAIAADFYYKAFLQRDLNKHGAERLVEYYSTRPFGVHDSEQRLQKLARYRTSDSVAMLLQR